MGIDITHHLLLKLNRQKDEYVLGKTAAIISR